MAPVNPVPSFFAPRGVDGMFDPLKRHGIQVVRKARLTVRETARRVDVARSSVTGVAKEGSVAELGGDIAPGARP